MLINDESFNSVLTPLSSNKHEQSMNNLHNARQRGFYSDILSKEGGPDLQVCLQLYIQQTLVCNTGTVKFLPSDQNFAWFTLDGIAQ